jgi:hypothetical protein
MKPLAVAADFRKIRVLQRARKAVQNTNFNHRPPAVTWKGIARDGAVAGAAAAAVVTAIADALPPAALKTRALAALDAEISALKAKYPGLTIEED